MIPLFLPVGRSKMAIIGFWSRLVGGNYYGKIERKEAKEAEFLPPTPQFPLSLSNKMTSPLVAFFLAFDFCIFHFFIASSRDDF